MASISDSHGQVVVYHENYDTPQVQFLTEDPPHSGPAWATAAGIAALSFRGLLPDDLVAVVSVDLPFLDLGLDALLTSDNECTDRSHTLGITSSGHQQWLLGVHRWDALRSLSAHAQPNQSLMSLFADVHPTWVVIEDEAAHDIDTPEDLATVLATLGCADSVREDSRATPAEQTLNDDDIGQYALPS
jgi:molybdopterin-guanine dinucleotide biosynthesis protein A